MSDNNQGFTNEIIPQPVITRMVNDYAVEQRAKDGYINATALTSVYQQVTGKRRNVSHWLELERTRETLTHLSSITGIPVIKLYQVFRGSPSSGGGTWIHPKLAIRFGIWLSDEFGYLVEEWVEQWLTAGQSPISSESLTNNDIQQILMDINQRLEQIEGRLNVLPPAKTKRPWSLAADTPQEEVPQDYTQIEDGSWLSPEAYSSSKRQSQRSLPWELREIRKRGNF
jgi:KilA-N domain